MGGFLAALAASGIKGGRTRSSGSGRSFIDPTQQPYLKDIYSRAQQLGTQGMPVEGTADINPQLRTALDNQYGAGGAIGSAGTGMMTAGGRLARGSNQALGFAQNAMQGGPQSGINTAMNTGQQFAGMGLLGGTATNAGLDPAGLSRYINNDILSGQIDAVGRDVTRNLTEQVKPTIAANAAVTGNSGSSRRAVQDAIAERGAADRMADISAGMRFNAYGKGLDIDAARASQNAQLMQAGRQFDAGQYNQMLTQGAGFGQDAYGRNQQAQQFGASLASDIGQRGFDQIGRGADLLRSGVAQQRDMGEFQRAYEQALLAQQQQEALSPYRGLEFYRSMVGAPTKLNETSNTSKSFNFALGG